MNATRRFTALGLWMLIAFPVLAQTPLHYPEARRSDHVDHYHGVAVPDPYRWMEDVNADETRAWLAKEGTLLDNFLEDIPGREALLQRIESLWNIDGFSNPRPAGGKYFYTRRTARVGPATLLVQDSLDATPTVLFDETSRLAGDSLNMGGFSPDPTGRIVAYVARKGQSRWYELHFADGGDGTELPDVVRGLHTLGGSISWSADGTGFYYTRFEVPEAGEELEARIDKPRIFYHRMGTSQDDDTLVFERPDHPNWLVTHTVTDDGRYLILNVRDDDTGVVHILYQDANDPGAPVQQLLDVDDAGFAFLGNDGTTLFFYTALDAPNGRIVAIDLHAPERDAWRDVVPEGDDPIAGNSQVGGNAVAYAGGHFIVTYLINGRQDVRVFDGTGHQAYTVDLPDVGAIWGGFVGRQETTDVFYSFLSLTGSSTVYQLNLDTGQSTIFKRPDLGFAPDTYVTEQVFFESEDGTRVPMFVTHKKDFRRDGKSPAFMYGYGAFGWVSFPWYQPHIVAWLEMGGIYALPGIRGGGEYGERWHQAGARHNKPNAIMDYVAAADWLVKNGYTSKGMLVANGGSASGIVAAAAVMRRPDLFGASVIDIPALDMLRYDLFTGAGHWIQEFGSAKNADDFPVLRSYSAYHNVKKGTCYPPVLTMVGERDETAVPMHGYKFTAAMQAAQACENPILLKVIRGAGHSHGTTPEQQSQTWADALSFVIRVLGLHPHLE